MKVSFNKARYFLITFILVLVSFSFGYIFGILGFVAQGKQFPKVHISRLTPSEKNLDFSLFWTVWDQLEASYVDKSKLIQSEMVYGAIKGMVSAVGDPYTVFLTPNENKLTQEDLQGSFGGVGIQIEAKGKQIAVAAPLPDTPASKAGVKAGDFIIGIKDDTKGIEVGTNGMSVIEAVKIIRGPVGSTVTLLLSREEEEEQLKVDLVREEIEVASVSQTIVDSPSGKVAHLKLLKFGAQTKGEWDKALRDINSQEVNKVVLDLRNNPGGYLDKAVEIVSEFTDPGVVALLREKSTGLKMEEKTHGGGKFKNFSVVVLINKGSASSSEIVAGALRDIRKIKLVGETSFGKGTVQEPQALANGAGLHITVEKWLTPSGYWVNDKGLEPDTKIEDNPDTEEDEQLREALKVL